MHETDKENEGPGKKIESVLPRILVYGTEQIDIRFYQYLNQIIKNSNYILRFADINTTEKFQDYDGVIMFQSTFEQFKRGDSFFEKSEITVTYNREELLKRRNQLIQLLKEGGFVCFLVYRPFITRTETRGDVRDRDLCKLCLETTNIRNFDKDLQITKIHIDEFKPFLDQFGMARSSFDPYRDKSAKTICETNDEIVGFISEDQIYFIPCILPSNDEIGDFFKKLSSALVSISKKLIQEAPEWAKDYKFETERILIERENKLLSEIETIEHTINTYNEYKRCLCYNSDLLVKSVENILEKGLGLTVGSKIEQFKEDRTILDEKQQAMVLIEIKGVNENIKNENISQVDHHRAQNDKPSDFPSILIANTFIKSSNSIADKMRDINQEQIKYAVSRQVLIMRTIDLLNLLYLKEEGKMKLSDIIDLFKNKIGWLKVSTEKYEIINK